MNESEEPPTEPEGESFGNLDEGLAAAYEAESNPSVIDRIGEITGSKPQIFLRGEPDKDAPMLKPLGAKDSNEAGKYVIHGEIGRGGVGTVNKGHDQDLGREVAMKFLHEKYKEDPAILHRFVEEAQIGGQLQHPGIVPVYDLGMSGGKPFFAMKLVKGQTLAKRLAERESTASERREFLAIFEDVCQTLAYAHARGVVHRDLKPANIMIGSFGEVQVVDWGMGKVLSSGGVADEKLAAQKHDDISMIETVRSGGQGTQSIMGSVMGTPAYMPPEQARGDVENMDERSDVFALGAILCEILTGLPPYVGDQRETLIMAATSKLEDAFVRLDASEGDPTMIDLAKRCLASDVGSRPRSAEVVAREVQGHLAAVEARVHEARVEAAEATVRAEGLKKAQRLGVGLIVVFAVGLAASLWFWRSAEVSATNEGLARVAAVKSEREAKRNEEIAIEQTEVAERELERAQEIRRLVASMLLSISPTQAKTADTTLLEEILDSTANRLESGEITDELVAADLHFLVGAVYRSINKLPKSELHLRAALETRSRRLGDEHPGTLMTRLQLVGAARFQGRMEEAEKLCLELLEDQLAVLGEDHPETLENQRHAAFFLQSRGEYAEAEAMMLKTLEGMKRVLGDEDTMTLAAKNDLSSLYSRQGRYEDQERLLEEILATRKAVFGDDDTEILAVLNNLAIAYQELGRYAEAEEALLETLEEGKRVYGEESPYITDSMTNLGMLYVRQNKNEEARPIMEEALERRLLVEGEKHPQTLVTMNVLATVYMGLNRFEEADEMYRELLELQKRVVGSEHPMTLGTITNLGLLYHSMERYEDAAEMFETSLEAKRRVLGVGHPWTGYAMSGLIDTYVALGRMEDAARLHRELVSLVVPAALNPDATQPTLSQAAETLLQDGMEEVSDQEQALEFATRAAAAAEAEAGEIPPAVLQTLAKALFRTGDAAGAAENLRSALARVPEGSEPDWEAELVEYEAAAREE